MQRRRHIDAAGHLRSGWPNEPQTDTEPDEPATPVPSADAGAGRGDAPPQPVNMNDVIRARVFGGSPDDWARHRQRTELA